MNWRAGSTIAVWFLVGVILYSIIKNGGVNLWDAATWQVVAFIATWLLAGGVAFAFSQVQQARRSTNAQIAISLFNELRSDETVRILHFIYNLKPERIKNLPNKGRSQNIDKDKNIDYVLDRLELLGALVKQGIIDERLAIEAYGGPPVLKCWYQLGENYIKEIQKQRGLFCKCIEDFAKRTVNYQLKHAPKDEWICFLKKIPLSQNDDKVNLVNVLKGSLLSRRERYWSWFIRYLKHPRWLCREHWPKKRVS